MTTQKDKLIFKLEELIKEGYVVKDQSMAYSEYGNYLTGEKYDHWISKAQLFLNTFFNNNPIKIKFDTAAEGAVGNGPDYFDTMVGVLIALKDSIDFILSSETMDRFKDQKFEKIFISHSSRDADYVETIIQLLNDIGISKSSERIFCSSFEGYNIPLGEKIYDYLKKQLNQNVLVLFILSKSYYDSIPCLNEMGATWVLSRAYQSILLPNFEFKNIEGAIDPTKICFRISESQKLNSFKDFIINNFRLENIDGSIWERDRDKFLQTIKTLSLRDQYSNSLTRIDISRIKPRGNNQLELDLRFINNGEVPVEFQEVTIELTDSIGKQLIIIVESSYLVDKIIYGGENRREVLLISYETTEYNYRNQKTWKVNSTTIPTY